MAPLHALSALQRFARLLDLISWISRNPRRQDSRPSLCSFSGCPLIPQHPRARNLLNSLQGQGVNLGLDGAETEDEVEYVSTRCLPTLIKDA